MSSILNSTGFGRPNVAITIKLIPTTRAKFQERLGRHGSRFIHLMFGRVGGMIMTIPLVAVALRVSSAVLITDGGCVKNDENLVFCFIIFLHVLKLEIL